MYLFILHVDVLLSTMTELVVECLSRVCSRAAATTSSPHATQPRTADALLAAAAPAPTVLPQDRNISNSNYFPILTLDTKLYDNVFVIF